MSDSAENVTPPVWCHEHMEPYCPRHAAYPEPSAENVTPESPFGPLGASGHDGHAPQLNGLLADCPGCVTPPEGGDRGEE